MAADFSAAVADFSAMTFAALSSVTTASRIFLEIEAKPTCPNGHGENIFNGFIANRKIKSGRSFERFRIVWRFVTIRLERRKRWRFIEAMGVNLFSNNSYRHCRSAGNFIAIHATGCGSGSLQQKWISIGLRGWRWSATRVVEEDEDLSIQSKP